MHFCQDVLRRLRLIDDRVVSALNSSLPTESFKALKNSEQQCKEFCEEVNYKRTAHLGHLLVLHWSFLANVRLNWHQPNAGVVEPQAHSAIVHWLLHNKYSDHSTIIMNATVVKSKLSIISQIFCQSRFLCRQNYLQNSILTFMNSTSKLSMSVIQLEIFNLSRSYHLLLTRH